MLGLEAAIDAKSEAAHSALLATGSSKSGLTSFPSHLKACQILLWILTLKVFTLNEDD